MRRVARLLSLLGGSVAVLLLSVYHANNIADPPYSLTGTSRFGWAIGYSLLLGITSYAVGLPDQPTRARHAAWLALVAVGVSAVCVSIPQLVLGDALLPRFVVFGAALVVVPWQVAVSRLAIDGRQRDEGRDRVLAIGEPAELDRLSQDLELEPERAASLVGVMTPADVGDDPSGGRLRDAAAQAGASLIVLDRSALSMDGVVAQAAALHEGGVRVRTLQDFYEEWLGKLPVSELERASLFFDIGELHRLRYGRRKRVLDLGIAILALPFLALVTPVVIVGNLVASRGPLLFRQSRVGKSGRLFTILKFRTMVPDAPDGAPAPPGAAGRWTELHDPRVTRFGRVLRRSHLDELPQLVNVLRGDLSIVGPRPEQPAYVRRLNDELPFYDMRHLVRPGITGWAQVKYGYAGDEHDSLEKLQYEFFYLRRQSLTFDLRILLRTARASVGGRGAGR